MPRTFDSTSELRLTTCEVRLADVLRRALAVTPYPFRIVQTSRTTEQQRQYFREKKSRIDPDAYDSLAQLYRVAKHVTGPGMPYSRAVDIALVGPKPYERAKLTHLAGTIRTIAQEVGLRIRWGADFDRDGHAYEPGTFIDAPHFEIDE